MRRASLLFLILVSSLATRCARNTEEVALDEPLAPPGTVERDPYLVTVTDSSAVLRWRTRQPAQPGIRFWANEDTTALVLPEEGRDHTFQMLNLAPETEYLYQIQLNDTLWTEAATFRTFPEPGDKDAFTFLALGDTGTRSSGQLALAERINEEEAAFVIHTGDVAYQSGTDLELTQNHFSVYAPLFKRAPFFPSPGDHDLRTAFGQPYIDAFTPPGGHASDAALYYSFTYGNARFIALFSNDDLEFAAQYSMLSDPGSDQYQWLLRQLSLARSDPGIDWIIVFFHHPPYSASTGFGGHGSDLQLRATVSPLMDGYQVPIVFNGHDHDYQRTRPIRGNAVVEENEGTVYVVTGGGGGRRTFRGTGADWFTASSAQVYHYMRVRVDHYTMGLEAVDVDGNVIDSFELSIPEERRKAYIRDAAPLTIGEPPEGEATEPEAEGETIAVPAGSTP